MRTSAFLPLLALLAGCPPIAPTEPLTPTPTDGPPTLPSTCTELTNPQVAVDTELADGCYTISASLNITAAITLPAGTTITVAPDVFITVEPGGSLTANGTEGLPVRIQGQDNISSTWGGLGFRGSNSLDNQLSYVEIDGAGSAGWTGSSASFGGLYLSANATVTADHITVSNIETTGVNLDSGEANLQLDTLDTDANTPMRMRLKQAEGLSGELSFTGSADAILVESGTVETPTTIPAYTYFVVGDQFVAGELTIQPGAVLRFDQNTSLDINTGSLNAIGTEALPISFQGDEPLAGFWYGVRFTNTLSAANRLEHVSILDGGGSQWNGATYSSAGLTLMGSDVRLTLQNAHVANSESAALLIQADSVANRISIQDSTFEDSAEPAKVSIDALKAFGSGNTFSGNDDERIRMFLDTNADEDATWSDLGIPYFFSEDANISAAIDIEPGVEIQFAGGVGLRVQPTGTLDVGSTGEPVHLTGESPVTGFWRGLHLAGSANANAITNTRIEYAGSGPWNGSPTSVYPVFLGGNARLDLTDTVFADNGGVVSLFADSTSTLTGCTGVVGTNDGDDTATFCLFP